MEKEELQLQHRFVELADKAYNQNVYTFTGFLSLSQQDIFLKMANEINHISYQMSGGSNDCERKMLRFGNPEEFGYEEAFPIVCIRIRPLQKKFAEDFSHRDVLGALMNLGIERSTLGDIFLADKEAFLFCQEKVAAFICDGLIQVRHTRVCCEPIENAGDLPVREPVMEEITVNSERADGVIAKLYHLSRDKSQHLFAEKKIYVNGRLLENAGRSLKKDELITVRGFGRFLYKGICYETKKGKFCVSAEVYR